MYPSFSQSLLERLLYKFQKLFYSDTVLHAPDEELTNEINNEIIENVTTTIKSALPGKPVYDTFGNHDYCEYKSLMYPSFSQSLLERLLYKFQKLFYSDTVLHAPDEELTNEINNEIIENVTTTIKSALPGKPVYATFGNHDYHPSDQYPPHNNQLYYITLLRWMTWISDATQDDTFTKGGYYTARTPHGLRIIALNTNLFYIFNRQVQHVKDPSDHLGWLNRTLKEAQENGEKVIVTAHIPLGIASPEGTLSMYEMFHTALVIILQTYADIIVGMHFGHDHTDSSNADGIPTVPVFMAPSITPAEDHNPVIRLVKYDRITGNHLDIEQYYLDLTKANKNISFTWELEYRASEAYILPDISAQSLVELTQRMKKPEGHVFQNFWKYHRVSLSEELQRTWTRDVKCHASFICGVTELHQNTFLHCVQTILMGDSNSARCPMFSTALISAIFLSFV